MEQLILRSAPAEGTDEKGDTYAPFHAAFPLAFSVAASVPRTATGHCSFGVISVKFEALNHCITSSYVCLDWYRGEYQSNVSRTRQAAFFSLLIGSATFRRLPSSGTRASGP